MRIGRTGEKIIDKNNSVSDKDVVLDGDSFADEAVTRNFAIPANFGVLLDFYEGAYLGVVAYLAAI
jgi:hypothetical protein